MVNTFLAFDYGRKRTGLAVGNDLLRTAQPLPAMATPKNGRLSLDAVRVLVKEWKITQLIFGAPLNAEGEETDMSKQIRKAGNRLAQELALPVNFVDERYSSGAADRLLRELQPAGRKLSTKKIALRDSLAAELILKTYFSRA